MQSPLIKFFAPLLSIITMSAWLTACSLDGDDDENETAVVIIGLTDAAGDFLSYRVNVTSVQLTRANGDSVETLPLSTIVDFAQYAELTEFLTAASVPSGVYTQARLQLDYRNAQILVEDSNGNAVEARAVNSSGDPIETLELRVELANDDTFRITADIPQHITLDFDLAASHSVDLSNTPAEVTVQPILLADVILQEPKQHRLRGLLDEVNTDDEIFSVRIRPFTHLNGDFGLLRVHTNAQTQYEIDGVSFATAEGLARLATLAAESAIIVLGELNIEERTFTALHVFAGSSVPWGDKDVAEGYVVARDDHQLTLRGASLIRSNNAIVFHETITIMLDNDTAVTQQGMVNAALDNNAISVGQHITAIGEFSDNSMQATHVRLLYSRLSGSVVQSSPLIIDLDTIGRHRITAFDFNGTGNGEDADPDHYEIDTGHLSLAGINLESRIRVWGFVTAFGMAPPDFSARTLINQTHIPAQLRLQWAEDGATAPFSVMSTQALNINLDAATLGEWHHVFQAERRIDLHDFDRSFSLRAKQPDRGLYLLKRATGAQLFHTFAAFETALSTALDGEIALTGLHAIGHLDENAAALDARVIIARLR